MPCLEASSCPHSIDTRSIGGSNQEPRETEPLLCGLSLLRGGWLLSLGLLLGSTLSLASSSRLGLRRSPEGLEKHVGLAIRGHTHEHHSVWSATYQVVPQELHDECRVLVALLAKKDKNKKRDERRRKTTSRG